MQGLAAKLVSKDFIDYVNSFDVVCLTETYLDRGYDFQVFKDFEVFISPAKKISRKGRRSGGVLVLVKKYCAAYFDEVSVDYSNIIVLRISKDLFSLDKQIFTAPCSANSPPYLMPCYNMRGEKFKL